MLNINKDDMFDYYQEVARSAFADMLHDTERNRKYAIGLEKSIKFMKSRGKPARVLDIGTGTGLLAMLASSFGADSVVTLEAFSPVSYVARKVIEENGFKDKIKVVNKHSTLVEVGLGKDMDEKANILVAEVFDTELIGEGAIRTYNHALENLMEKDCLAVPESATVYVQVVDCDLAISWNTFRNMENFKCPENVSKCLGNPAIHDLQLSQLSPDLFKVLTEPTKVCVFEFTGKKKIPYSETFNTSVEILRNGNANAVFFWWEIKMCFEVSPVLSCAPFWAHPDIEQLKSINTNEDLCNIIPWRDHWMQGCFYLKPNMEFHKNSSLVLQSSHDEFSWFFNVKNSSDENFSPPKPACTCIFHITTSRNRIMQINSEKRRELYRKVLMQQHSQWKDDEVILFLGDNSFLPFELPLSTKTRKMLLQENPLCYRNIKNFIEYNRSDVNVISDLSEIEGEQITRIISEPHFDKSILTWDNILELRSRIRKFRNDHVSVNPISARIFAIPVHFLHLHKIRWPLKSSCEGFDHKTFDEVIDFASSIADENVEAFSLWEYPCRALGKSKVIFNLSFVDDTTTVRNEITLSIEKTNENCNGIAFWVEWEIDKNVFSSCGPENNDNVQIGELIKWKMEERQAVHLIPASKIDGKNGRIEKIAITTCLDEYERLSMNFTYYCDGNKRNATT